MLEFAHGRDKKMFCPNCGKQIKDSDNFCRYCGCDLRSDALIDEYPQTYASEEIHLNFKDENTKVEEDDKYELPSDDAEEFLLYDIKKHWMALFWPIVLTPVFFVYFWNIFLNTHSLFSWVVVFCILAAIIYPILRYIYDKIIITTKFAHIKIGVLNPVEIDIPLKQLDRLDVTQTSMGKILDYGMVSFTANSERYEYRYIKNPDDLQYIIDNPAKFVKECLSEEEIC